MIRPSTVRESLIRMQASRPWDVSRVESLSWCVEAMAGIGEGPRVRNVMGMHTVRITTGRKRSSWYGAALLAVMLGLAGLSAPAMRAQESTPDAAAQGTPVVVLQASPEAATSATPAADQPSATISTLFEYQLDEFPPAPVSIRLLRITLQPGASSPMHTHPGPEFDLVESGTLTVRADGDAVVNRAGTPEPVPAEGTSVNPGEFVVFPPGTGMNLVNESDQELVLLSAVFHPVNEDVPSTTYTDGEPAANAFDGVSFVVLGDGIVQEFPTGPVTITLDSIVLPAGADLPATSGLALYSKVDGNFSFRVDGGNVQVSRSASPGLRPNAAPEQEFTLETSDAAFFPDGSAAASRSGEAGDLSLLRLSAVPAEPLTTTPASISFISGSETAGGNDPSDGTAAGADQPTEIGIGVTVFTNTDAVNLRGDPSIEADGVDQLGNGVELEITDGPIEADGFTWYFVEVVGTDGPTEGWVAQDFISLPGAPPSGTPVPADSTPVAADDETFAEGDTVVANADNVRVRADASTGADILQAYPAGTEFLITGEPEEADGFTWYPVQVVEDEEVTGFVVADFLDPAP